MNILNQIRTTDQNIQDYRKRLYAKTKPESEVKNIQLYDLLEIIDQQNSVLTEILISLKSQQGDTL